TCSGVDEWNCKFFVNDRENPYTTDPGKPFLWIRGRHVGGRSIMWGRQSYRWSDLDFEANLREGIAIDWPIRYQDIAPWYDYVEDFIGVTGQTEGLPQLMGWSAASDTAGVKEAYGGGVPWNYTRSELTLARQCFIWLGSTCVAKLWCARSFRASDCYTSRRT